MSTWNCTCPGEVGKTIDLADLQRCLFGLKKVGFSSNEARLRFDTLPPRHDAFSSTLTTQAASLCQQERVERGLGRRAALIKALLPSSFPFVLLPLFEDAHKPNIRCNNVWKPQAHLKSLAENAQTPDPHKLTRCCENGDGICYQCPLCW